MHSSIMTTKTAGPPTEVLIPEARQHQKRRYRRRGAFVVIAALVVAALVLSSLLLLRGPADGGRAQADPKPPAAAAVSASGAVYFRPVLCFAAPYIAPAGASSTAGQTGNQPIPACSAASLLSAANMDVMPRSSSPIGFSYNTIAPDPQYASYPSTSVGKPGYASSTVLLPGLSGACDQTSATRCVLGPAMMSSRAIARATVVRTQAGGQWMVDYTTTDAGASVWDKVANENFHQLLGIELHGVVYSAPIMQPSQSSFSSFDGRGEISGNLSHSAAVRLARALNAHHG
jgi:hypothetical protein